MASRGRTTRANTLGEPWPAPQPTRLATACPLCAQISRNGVSIYQLHTLGTCFFFFFFFFFFFKKKKKKKKKKKNSLSRSMIRRLRDNADHGRSVPGQKFSSIATPERPRKIPLGKHRYRFGSQLPSWAETPCASNEYCGEREEHAVPSVARTAVSPDLPVVNESVAVPISGMAGRVGIRGVGDGGGHRG